MYPIWCLLTLLFEIFPCILAKLLQCVWLFMTLWTVTLQAFGPWDSPGKNTGVGCHTFLQGIFLTQGLNPHPIWWNKSNIGILWLFSLELYQCDSATLCFYFVFRPTFIQQFPHLHCLYVFSLPHIYPLAYCLFACLLLAYCLLTACFCFPHNFSLYIKLSRPLWLFSLCSQYRLLQIFKLKTVDFPRSSFKSGPIITHWKTDRLTALSLRPRLIVQLCMDKVQRWSSRLTPSAATVVASVQFSHSVMSDSLQPHELQHARPPCPSQTPRVYSNSCPSSQWGHLTISPSVIPFSSCPQPFPASGSFAMSQLFASGGQSIGVSASSSVLPMNTQDSSPSGWTGWISLQSKGLSRVFSNTTVQKHQFFCAQLSSQSNSHIHTWPLV